MNVKNAISAFSRLPVLVGILALTLIGCGSDDEESQLGNFQLYNASSNSPALALKVKLDDKEKDHGPVGYGTSTNYFKTAPGTYGLEIVYQKTSSSQESIYQTDLPLDENFIQLMVVSGDIAAADITSYNIPVDDPETEEGVFNARVLNTHSASDNIDVYISQFDESFSQAELFSQVAYGALTESKEFDIGYYIFYITLAGSEEILFQTDPQTFAYTSQYILAVRENTGPGTSPYAIDRISSANIDEHYYDASSDSEYRIYNGLTKHDLIPAYQGAFDLHLDGIDDTPEISALESHQFSDTITIPAGDYGVDLVNTGDNISLVANNLLTLPNNTDRTSFIYLAEEVTTDENGDEETNAYVRSLVVNNSSRSSLYDHQVNAINLVDDFSIIDIYFVRSNETTDTAFFNMRSRYLEPQGITLLNNTYDIVAVSNINGNRMLVSRLDDVTLDEDSGEMFLIIEQQDPLIEEYTMTLTAQKPATTESE